MKYEMNIVKTWLIHANNSNDGAIYGSEMKTQFRMCYFDLS